MKNFASEDARDRFPEMIEAAQQGPIRLTDHGRPVAVVLSLAQYERLRGAAWDRLAKAMDAVGAEAERRGLTETALESLLAGES